MTSHLDDQFISFFMVWMFGFIFCGNWIDDEPADRNMTPALFLKK